MASFTNFAKSQAGALVLDSSQHNFIKYLNSINIPCKSKGFFSSLKSKMFEANPVLGIYIHGESGRGKSMILKWYIDYLNDHSYCYMHFHKFMLWVHKMLAEFGSKYKDPLAHLVNVIVKQNKLLVLDELQINNIADAMIVSRLFSLLYHKKVIIIISSNRIPEDLYIDGLQRERFLPFISFIKHKYEIINVDNNIDYRLSNFDAKDLYIVSDNVRLDTHIKSIIGENELEESPLMVAENHTVQLRRTHGRLAVFDFWELCKTDMGATEYVAICEHFSVIVIYNIPKLSGSEHNELLRFITLIDCMYDSRAKLICSAECVPEELYTKGMHAFEFKRTISRLNEMKSFSYFKE